MSPDAFSVRSGASPDATLDRPRHILTLPWAFAGVGGVDEVVRNLIVFLKTHDENVAFYTPGPSRVIRFTDTVEITSQTAQDFTLCSNRPAPERYFRSLWRMARAFMFWRRELARSRTNHVYIHFPADGAVAPILARRMCSPCSTITLSFHLSDVRLAHEARGLSRLAYGWILRNADNGWVLTQR